MTLPDIIALQQEIMSAFEALKKGQRVDFRGCEIHMDMGIRGVQMVDHILLTYVATQRLGKPGGPAPVEGGSFDWEVLVNISGDVRFIIKSYTDQPTIDRLQAQYRRFSGRPNDGFGDDPYDFR